MSDEKSERKSACYQKGKHMTNAQKFPTEVYQAYADRLNSHLEGIFYETSDPEVKRAAEVLGETLSGIINLLSSEYSGDRTQGIDALVAMRGEDIARWHKSHWERLWQEIQEEEFYTADRSICPELWTDPRSYTEMAVTHAECPCEFADFVAPEDCRMIAVRVK